MNARRERRTSSAVCLGVRLAGRSGCDWCREPGVRVRWPSIGRIVDVSDRDVDGSAPDEGSDRSPDLFDGAVARRRPAAAALDSDSCLVDRHPRHTPPRQIGRGTPGAPRSEIGDEVARAHGFSDGVDIDTVHHGRARTGTDSAHETRDGVSSSSEATWTSSTLTLTSTTSSPVISSTCCLTLRWMLRPRSAIDTPYSTTMSRSIAVWVSPTSTPTPCAMFGPDAPGILSLFAPNVRVLLLPMACTPLTSRQDLPAIFCTTDCAT